MEKKDVCMKSELELDKIIKIKKMVSNIWLSGDKFSYPIPLSEYCHYRYPVFITNIVECIEEGYCVTNPTLANVFRMLDFLIISFFIKKSSKKDNQKVMNNYLRFFSNYFIDTNLERDFEYKILNNIRVKKGSINVLKFSDIEKTKLEKFLSLLRIYVESIYFKLYDISQEVHGPYNILGMADKIIVWNFRNLIPENKNSNMQYFYHDNIQICVFYSALHNMRIDQYNHVIFQNNDFILTGYDIIVDGKKCKINDTEYMVSDLEKIVKQNFINIQSCTLEMIIECYDKIFKEKMKILFGIDVNMEMKNNKVIKYGYTENNEYRTSEIVKLLSLFL